MLNNVSFGQYYPTSSFVHKLDPRVKIVLSLLFIVGVFLADDFVSYGVFALFLVILIVVSRVPLTSVLRSVKGVIFLIILTAVLNVFFYGGSEATQVWEWWIFKVSDASLIFAAKMAMRLLFVVLSTSMLTYTTKPMELTDGIESLLYPLKLLHVPVHDGAVVISIALRFIPTLMEETDKIMMAQKSRGADFDSGNLLKRAKALVPVLIPLFVSAFRRADELAYAMDSRCYNATPNRTRRKVMKLSFRDVIATVLVGGIFALAIVM